VLLSPNVSFPSSSSRTLKRDASLLARGYIRDPFTDLHLLRCYINCPRLRASRRLEAGLMELETQDAELADAQLTCLELRIKLGKARKNRSRMIDALLGALRCKAAFTRLVFQRGAKTLSRYADSRNCVPAFLPN